MLERYRNARSAIALLGGAISSAICFYAGLSLAREGGQGLTDPHFQRYPQMRDWRFVTIDTGGAVENTLPAMNDHGLAIAVLMPPPMPPEPVNAVWRGAFDTRMPSGCIGFPDPIASRFQGFIGR
jgi:hypothetical protein